MSTHDPVDPARSVHSADPVGAAQATGPGPQAHPPGVSTRWLVHAPHRLMFFIGAGNVLLAMAWWALWLGAAHAPTAPMPQPPVYAGWLHAFVMQYQVLPSFFFGFLLTTFPKWMAQPDLSRRHYVPVGLGMFGGQLATLLGAASWSAGVATGLALTLAGWGAGLAILGTLLLRDRSRSWHARSCWAALALGFAGLIAWGMFLSGGSALWAFASIKIGTFGLLLPVYVTVAHRMFPFFASRVVPGYVAWRPMWLLGAFWPLCLAHLSLELVHAYGWLWIVDLPLLALSLLMLWRWWPRGPQPGLLVVLFAGLSWLPIAFALYAVQSVAYAMTGIYWLGRGPGHALFVGFFGSILVAMVTRVTAGHSGRPLTMSATAWFAFVVIQLVAIVRIAADAVPNGATWQALAALGWLVALTPWVLRIGRIYLAPRVDGRPG